MSQKHEILIGNAETAITSLFRDTSVGRLETANTLHELIAYIENMINKLDE